jgi:orotate phosphoribosyltransferase
MRKFHGRKSLLWTTFSISPYFFNAGLLSSGKLLDTLATGYANLIASKFGKEFDVLFGPAYKGIPLAGATALLLHRDHDINVGYAYDRKEAKMHGEGGRLVGAAVKGKRVLVLDDVMTAGTAIRNSIGMVREEGGTVVGFVMCLDREEIGPGGRSTVKEVEELIGKPGSMQSIIRMQDLTCWLEQEGQYEKVESMRNYSKEFGVKI